MCIFSRIFSVLSAILYLGNVTYKKRAAGRDEGLEVGPPEVLDILSQLLKVSPSFFKKKYPVLPFAEVAGCLWDGEVE